MRPRGQRGLILRYSNCTDLEWLRHFTVCFSQVLVVDLYFFIYFHCYFSTCWPCMSRRPHDDSTLPIMTATCQLRLILAALCRHAAHHRGPSKPIPPRSKLQAGTSQRTRILTLAITDTANMHVKYQGLYIHTFAFFLFCFDSSARLQRIK